MQETKEVNTIEDEGEDLIPKDLLPTDSAELGKEADNTAEPAVEEEEEVEVETEDEPKVIAPESSSDAKRIPAPVEGETPKEKALRLEIQRLRNINRKGDVKETFDNSQSTVLKADAYENLKTRYTAEQIADMELAIDTIAANKGFVKTDYGQTVQDVVDLFTESHPEYKPSNDPEDVRWNRFNAILKDGTYNLSGKTPKQLTKIFERVDADVKDELGETVVKVNPNQRAAQIHKVNVVSHSGGSKSSSEKIDKLDYSQPIGGIRFKGFDADD